MIVEESGERLDLFLSKHYEKFSRTYFQDLIEKGLVLVNGVREKKRYRVEEGDEIEVEFATPHEPTLTPEPIPFDILYEDDFLLAINKPAGLVVHPGTGNWSGTFVNGLIYYCQHLRGAEGLRPGIVHRLDKDTTGVLIAAKTTEVQQLLVAAFAERAVKKVYLAVCRGNPGNRLIKNRIGRHPMKRQQMAVLSEGGKEAITRIKVLQYDHQVASVVLLPETGRTHQLRVHMQALGCPIIGDSLYGSGSALGAERQLLHAYQLELTHPITKQPLKITAPIPQDMESYFDPKHLPL